MARRPRLSRVQRQGPRRLQAPSEDRARRVPRPAKPEASWGKADIVSTGEEDHYRVVTTLPNNPILKTLRMTSVAGSLVVSTDEEEEDSLPNNYITSSSKVSVLTSLLTIRLRAKYKKATFIFNVESPLGKQTCRGSGVKQPAKK